MCTVQKLWVVGGCFAETVKSFEYWEANQLPVSLANLFNMLNQDDWQDSARIIILMCMLFTA